MFDHLAVFQPVDVDDGLAGRIVRQTVPVAVEDDVVAVREDALDLAVRLRTIGEERGNELAEALHAVLNERIVLDIAATGIELERLFNVGFEYSFLVEGDGVGLIRFRHRLHLSAITVALDLG